MQQTFTRTTLVEASCEEVYDYYRTTAVFYRMVPPWEKVQHLDADEVLDSGTMVRLRYRGKDWISEIVDANRPYGFTRNLIQGPFAPTLYEYRFKKISDTQTEVTDHITYTIPWGWLGGLCLGKKSARRVQRIVEYRHKILQEDLKELFGQPRPSHLDPSLGLVRITSFGFPSGAAQGIVILLGFIMMTIKKQWLTWLSLFCILLVSFSRVYLGAHFFSDVVGGWIAGILLLSAYLYALPHIERLIARSSRSTLYILCGLGFVALMILGITPNCTSIAVFGLSVSLGLIWAPALKSTKTWLHKIRRLLIALGGLMLLILLQMRLRHFFLLFEILSGLWVGFGMFYLSKKLESWVKLPK